MKILSTFIIFLFPLFYTGCNSNSIEPIPIENNEIIHISGALNKSFNILETNYDCQTIVKSWDIGNTLILSIRGKSETENTEEQISLTLYFPLGQDDYPETGKYYSNNFSDNFSGVSYKNQWNENSFSKYRFETDAAKIIFEESENSNLSGKFSLIAKQSYGQRILNGQVENIQLAHDGKITVSGKIDIVLDR